jgi:hypothetical protein
MMKNHYPLGLLALAVLCLAVACKPTQTLRINADQIPTKSRLVYERFQKTEMELSVPGGSTQNTYETETTTYAFELLERYSDGSTRWKMHTLRQQSVENEEGTVTRVDSDQPLDSTDMKARAIAVVIRTPMEYTLSSRGEVSNFTGTDVLWAGLARELAGSPDELKALVPLKTQFGKEFFEASMAEVWTIYPAKKVRVGSKWKEPHRIEAFKLSGTNTFELAAMSADSARIDYVTTYKNDPDNPGELKIGPVSILYYLAGERTGYVTLEQPSGLPICNAYRVRLAGHMSVKMPTQASVKIPCTLDLEGAFLRK